MSVIDHINVFYCLKHLVNQIMENSTSVRQQALAVSQILLVLKQILILK